MTNSDPALPDTMRVLGQRRYGGVEVLEELRLPVPQAEGADLLVRMQAVGLNPVDTKVRSNWGGFGDFQSGDPVITGWDGAGEVVACGPEADGRFQPGDAVMFAGSVARAGCQREYALVDSRLVGRRPANLRPAVAVVSLKGAARFIHELPQTVPCRPDPSRGRLPGLRAHNLVSRHPLLLLIGAPVNGSTSHAEAALGLFQRSAQDRGPCACCSGLI
jgi:hypothetical protein